MTIPEFIIWYKRDLNKLIDEINSFRMEENIWKINGSVKNTAGNLALHLTGGLNFLIGTTLGNTGYIRDRDKEFSIKGIDRDTIVSGIQDLIIMIEETISSLNDEQLKQPFPIFFDKENASIGYVLTQLLLHLNYHLGQINYLRRSLE